MARQVNGHEDSGRIRAGELFGEMSCLYRTPRSATVVARRDCYMIEMLRNILDMIQKDLRLALDMARASAVTLPSVALTHELLTAAKGKGLAHYDFAVIFDILAEMSGLPPSEKL